MLKFCKILTPLNPDLVYKKPRIHPKIPKPNGPHSLGLFFYSLQILLDPVHGRDPVHGLEGQVEGRLAFEAGALRDALDGGGQVRTFAKEIGRMPDAQRIAVEGKGDLQLLVEAFGDALLGDIERNGDVVLGKIFF